MKNPGQWRGLNWGRDSGLPDYERESSDNPRLNAFCRVAPSVRFRVRTMLAAPVFLRAIVFSVRTSDEVHERRFDFLGIPIISEWKGRDLVARICWKEKQKNAAKGCRTIHVISLRATPYAPCRDREMRLDDGDAWRLINIVFWGILLLIGIRLALALMQMI